MEPYKTSDQDLAAYLMLKGMKIVDTAPSEKPNRQNYIFVDEQFRDDLVQEFLSGRDSVSASAYARARRAVRRYLK